MINPKADTVLGAMPLGTVRLDTNADVLGAMYDGDIDVHGLGFARNGRYLDVMGCDDERRARHRHPHQQGRMDDLPRSHGPHGIWPSNDNTPVYVALQYSGVDVIDTKAMKLIKTLHVGQSRMALVYVARSG